MGEEKRGKKKKALSQAIKLNIELHSSSCLSMPLLLMLPPKQRIKGLECGVGKSQALTLPACYICKSLRQKRGSRAEIETKKKERCRGEVAWNAAKWHVLCLMTDKRLIQSAGLFAE